MSEADAVTLTKEELEKYGNWLFNRWVTNSRRFESAFITSVRTVLDSPVKLLLAQQLHEWLRSPQSIVKEAAWLVAGYRHVQNGVLISTGKFVELSQGAFEETPTSVRLDYGVIGYAVFSGFSKDEEMEPIMIIHTHPRNIPSQTFRFSGSADTPFIRSFHHGMQNFPPLRGIWLGLASLDQQSQLQMKAATAITPNEIIEQLLPMQ